MATAGQLLIVVASEPEAEAVRPAIAAQGGVDLLVCGVGKASAAAGLARRIARASTPPPRILNLGIAGTLDAHAFPIGATVLADPSRFADEGIITSGRFVSCREMGFPIRPTADNDDFPPDRSLADALRPFAQAAPVATVSTCSGTDAAADAARRRTGAAAEAMEGAALALAAADADASGAVPFAELRVISNTTGDRERQTWDIPRAMSRLTDVARLAIPAAAVW